MTRPVGIGREARRRGDGEIVRDMNIIRHIGGITDARGPLRASWSIVLPNAEHERWLTELYARYERENRQAPARRSEPFRASAGHPFTQTSFLLAVDAALTLAIRPVVAGFKGWSFTKAFKEVGDRRNRDGSTVRSARAVVEVESDEIARAWLLFARGQTFERAYTEVEILTAVRDGMDELFENLHGK